MSKAYELAEKFFEKEWNDEKIKIHSKTVIDCALGMIKNTTLNPEIFEIAGWIHDLGRKIDKDTHPEIGIKIFEKFLEENPQFKNLEIEIKDCILNHGRKRNPKTIYGRIMQAADKASLYHKEWIKYKN